MNIKETNPNLRKCEYFSKLTIFSTVLLFLWILWIPFVILTNNTFIDYGWAVNYSGNNIPVHEQEYRLWLLLFSSLILLVSVFNLYFSIRIYKLNTRDWVYLLGFGFFSFLFCVNLWLTDYRYRFISYYRSYLNFHIITNYQVSFYHLFTNFKWDKLTRNTLLFILTFLINLVGFIFVLIPDLSSDGYLDNLFVYNSLSYFTRLTNIGCFLTLLVFCYIQTRTFANNNTFTLYMCSYITVVAFIYWVVLFPQNMVNGSFQRKSPFELAETIWLHAISPVFFIWFMINSYCISLMRPNSKIWKNLLLINVYPLWYFSYAYFIPFLAKESIYGFITNLNPDGYVFSNLKFVKNGNPVHVLTIFVFGLVFICFYLLYRLINIKIVNNRCFYQNKVNLY